MDVCLITNLNTDSKNFGLRSKHTQTTIYGKYLFTKTKTCTLAGIFEDKNVTLCYCIPFNFGNFYF